MPRACACVRARARARGIHPVAALRGEKSIDLQASVSQFLSSQIAGIFSSILSKVLWGSSEWNAISFSHRVPVRGEGGLQSAGILPNKI